jgi:hypothetical protein
MYTLLHVKYPLILSGFNKTLIKYHTSWKKSVYCEPRCSMRTDRQRKGRTDGHFANAPNKQGSDIILKASCELYSNQNYDSSHTQFQETEYAFYSNLQNPSHLLCILLSPTGPSVVLWGYPLFSCNKPKGSSQDILVKNKTKKRVRIQTQLECLTEITCKIRVGW